MAPATTRSLNRLSKDALIDLALRWIQHPRTSAPYLLGNRTFNEADEEDYLHTPAESLEALRRFYQDLREDNTKTKRDVIDRIVDGDWRRGLSLHQHAMVDFAHLEQHDAALRWSALRLVPLECEEEKEHLESRRPCKKRKLGHAAAHYPHTLAQAFVTALKAEVSPLVKAHYHIHRTNSPRPLSIVRLYISPSTAFAPRRSKIPRRAKHATDSGRVMYIALPDSCPYVYISISGTSGSTRSKGLRDAAKNARNTARLLDMAAMKRVILEAIPKAVSRPQQRWALEPTKLVAKSLKTMCELRGNQKPGTGGGAYGSFSTDDRASEQSPVDVQIHGGTHQADERHSRVRQRFGDMTGDHHAVINRVHVKMSSGVAAVAPQPASAAGEAATSAGGGGDVALTFCGSDVFLGLKKLAELGPGFVDLGRMPASMTGELGVSSFVV